MLLFQHFCIALLVSGIAGLYYNGQYDNAPYRGVSLAGPEFLTPVFPKKEAILYFAIRGVNIIRMPFRWDYAQLGLQKELNETFVSHIEMLTDYAASLGVVTILDCHQYARYPFYDNTTSAFGMGSLIGKQLSSVSNQHIAGSVASFSDFRDFWTRMALRFKRNTYVWYGLVNEPTADTDIGWYTYGPEDAYNLALAGLSGVRGAGATSKVVLSGTVWSGAASWYGYPASSEGNGQIFARGINDGNIVVEVHTYFDNNFAGISTECKPLGTADQQWDASTLFSALTTWATDHNYQLLLGEFGFVRNIGTPGSANCAGDANNLIDYLHANGVNSAKNGPWLGWIYWAAGGAWGNNRTDPYTGGFSIQPDFFAPEEGPCDPDVRRDCLITGQPQFTDTLAKYFSIGSVTPLPSTSANAPQDCRTVPSSETLIFGPGGNCTIKNCIKNCDVTMKCTSFINAQCARFWSCKPAQGDPIMNITINVCSSIAGTNSDQTKNYFYNLDYTYSVTKWPAYVPPANSDSTANPDSTTWTKKSRGPSYVIISGLIAMGISLVIVVLAIYLSSPKSTVLTSAKIK